MITRDQERARHAYGCVGPIAVWKTRERSGYRTLARGFGALVMGNGLIGALAFVRRYHRPKAATAFLQHLAQAGIPGVAADDKGRVDIAAVCGLQSAEYMLATREALQVALWLKRAATAVIPTEKEDDGVADGRAQGGV